MLNRSACLEILYGHHNWVLGSICLDATRKFNPCKAPSSLVIHTPEKTGLMCKKTSMFTMRTSALAKTFMVLDFRNFSTLLGHKSQWKENLAGNEDGTRSHQGVDWPRGGGRACGWVTPGPITEGRGHGPKMCSSGTHKTSRTYDIACHVSRTAKTPE